MSYPAYQMESIEVGSYANQQTFSAIEIACFQDAVPRQTLVLGFKVQAVLLITNVNLSLQNPRTLKNYTRSTLHRLYRRNVKKVFFFINNVPN